MNRICFIHIHDSQNLGDQVCCPIDYFPEFQLLGPVEQLDAWTSDFPQDAHLIFGGGGLLHGALIEAIRQTPRNSNRKLIWWGAGHNIHGSASIKYFDWLEGFTTVGSRDFRGETGSEYVPCPSCLHPAFTDLRRHEENGIVVLEHHLVPIDFPGDIKLNNDKRKNEMRAVLNLLAGARAVVTNTYHGAYWSLLLGKKVIIYKPFSSRFYGFKPSVSYWDGDDDIGILEQLIENTEEPPQGYLRECCNINFAFAARVKGLL